MPLVIKRTIESADELKREFARFNRDYFSDEGYQALIEYFDGDEERELDVVAICCDFCEVDLHEFVREWCETEEYIVDAVRRYAEDNLGWYQLLNENTTIIYSA